MRQILRSLLILFSIAPGFSFAEEFDVQSGFSAEALRPSEDQIGCRHLEARYRQREVSLEKFNAAQVQLSRASIDGQLKEFFRRRSGYPIDSLYSEPVYRIRYVLDSAKMEGLLSGAQSRAVWGQGFFEQQNPNGNFERMHYQVNRNADGRPELEFDVRAADVCLAHRLDLVFFSGCPLEIIHGEEWDSPPFVVEWWKCEQSSTVSFDLTELTKTLGRRSRVVGGTHP